MPIETHLLLVEDRPEDAFLVEKIIRRALGEDEALVITKAGSLAAAIEKLGQQHFGCVLLDLGLPDARGLSTLRRLRSVNEKIPVVVLSGIDDEQTALSAVEYGAHAYVAKRGIDDSENIWAVVQEAIRSRAPTPLRTATALTRRGHFRLDGKNRIIRWDEQCERLLQWKAEEVQFRPLLELVARSRRDEVSATLERPTHHGGQTLQLKMLCADGKSRLVEIQPELTVEGSRERQWQMADAEAGRRANQAMQVLSTILSATGDIVISQDLDGRIHSCSSAVRSALGQAPKAIIGRRFRDIFVTAEKAMATNILASMRRGRSIKAQKAHWLNADGEAVALLLTASPVRDELGGLIGACIVGHPLPSEAASDSDLQERCARLEQSLTELENENAQLLEQLRTLRQASADAPAADDRGSGS